MMRSPMIVLCLVIGLIGLGLAPASAAEKKASQQGQQQLIKSCTDQANAKNLSGDAKKNFINTCMKNG
jgi:psiF repeat-containing protein